VREPTEGALLSRLQKTAKLEPASTNRETAMCDYSIHAARSRPARVDDRLTNHKFGGGSRGFCAPEDAEIAVCLLPGTELSFVEEVAGIRLWPWSKLVTHKTAIFRQVNTRNRRTHHDALEFPDGQIVLLTFMPKGLQAVVLQLPVTAGAKAPQRAAKFRAPFFA